MNPEHEILPPDVITRGLAFIREGSDQQVLEWRMREGREFHDAVGDGASGGDAIHAMLAACEPVAWTKRPGEPPDLEPYWSFVPTDLVKRARAALSRDDPPQETT